MLARIADSVGQFLNKILGPESSFRGPVIALLTILILLLVYKLTTRLLRRYLRNRAYKSENIENFLLLWRYVWMGFAFILALVALSGSIASLGISAAFLGMILGWSLQAPVTGVAAWLMIILKRPFKIGDRIIIAGITGDVEDITLTHIVLNQVGGTIGGEEKSGRGVLIPNATLFQQIIYNYNFESRYLLDEVPILITYDSDFHEAARIAIQAAREVTGEIIRDTGQDPFIRAELADSGVRIRLRYQALSMERQRISSDIVCVLIREFNKNPYVEFCYPHTEILYRQKRDMGGQTLPPASDTGPRPDAESASDPQS